MCWASVELGEGNFTYPDCSCSTSGKASSMGVGGRKREKTRESQAWEHDHSTTSRRPSSKKRGSSMACLSRREDLSKSDSESKQAHFGPSRRCSKARSTAGVGRGSFHRCNARERAAELIQERGEGGGVGRHVAAATCHGPEREWAPGLEYAVAK